MTEHVNGWWALIIKKTGLRAAWRLFLFLKMTEGLYVFLAKWVVRWNVRFVVPADKGLIVI